jgi:DNA-directed RNA polymerase specialized sigma24 family protein/CheY-like chemotaxis protein
MSLSQEITPHLPYLRRYARALAGSQASGDAYVIETLEAILEAPHAFPRDLGVRVGLYRILSSLYLPMMKAGLAAVDDAREGDSFDKTLRNLASLTARSRQAFLLKAVEGFNCNEIATILNIDLNTVTKWISEAGREISQCVVTDVLIIEDEALIAAELSMIVRELGHSVVGVARTQREALALTERRRPGLILADINLADGSSGVCAVNEILQRQDTPIIFITAYPERLLTGVRPEPTFLLTKPYRLEAVKATIFQCLFFNQRAVPIPEGLSPGSEICSPQTL